jgi:hypothetical protein
LAAISVGAVGSKDNGSRPSAPLVTTIRLLADFQPASTGFSSSEYSSWPSLRSNGGMSEIIAACGSSASRSLRTLLSISPLVALIDAKVTGPFFGTAHTKLPVRPK